MAPRERNALMSLTRRLVKELDIAVLFTEHSMDVVFAHADRLMVLARGQLIAQGPPQQIRDDPKVAEVYFGSGRLVQAASAVSSPSRAPLPSPSRSPSPSPSPSPPRVSR